MKLKILYLIGFIFVIWLGMTKTGRNLLSLNNQTNEYTDKHNQFTIRFFGKTVPPLQAAVRPVKQGILLSPNTKNEMEFVFSNLSEEVQNIELTYEVTPTEAAHLLQIEPLKIQTLNPKENIKVPLQFKLAKDINFDIDTFYIKLHMKKSETEKGI